MDAGLFTAIAIKSYPVKGRMYCDLRAPGLGPVGRNGVPVCQLGGGRGRFMLLPVSASSRPLEGAEVVCGYLNGRGLVVLGVLGWSGQDAPVSDTEIGSHESESDLSGLDANTAGIVWDSASIITRDGAIALEAAGGQDVNAQLRGGQFRVSSDGEASDAAVLVRPLVEVLNAIVDKLNQHELQIAALTTAASGSAGIYIPVPIAPIVGEPLASKLLRVSGESQAG